MNQRRIVIRLELMLTKIENFFETFLPFEFPQFLLGLEFAKTYAQNVQSISFCASLKTNIDIKDPFK